MTTRTRPHPTIPEPRRRGSMRAVSELLPDIGGTAFRKFGFVQSAVVSRWGEIVGDRFARVSAPESIRFPPGKRAEGVLTLTVSGAHGTMMQHIAPEIVERVNRFFGYAAVARLVFRHGEVRPRRAAPPRREAPAIPQELGDSLRDIADPELKAVLTALAGAVAAPPPPAIPILGKVR
ncbi:DUF721 domain-containing protein [Sphingomonas sp. VNH70]|uniref:DUF721 domain-containing protein n=1 Tax=Sphingomonas silueang TaxID=3156617 RepID=UPI0032B4AA25